VPTQSERKRGEGGREGRVRRGRNRCVVVVVGDDDDDGDGNGGGGGGGGGCKSGDESVGYEKRRILRASKIGCRGERWWPRASARGRAASRR
jgi:hypothetical protein